MYKWEYKLVKTDGWSIYTFFADRDGFEFQLNKLGEDGWELVNEIERNGNKFLIFKRLVIENLESNLKGKIE